MTYQESSDLMNDFQFRGRIKVSALTYANYIFGESPSVPAHNTRFKWAVGCFQNPEGNAASLQPPVVMDAAVQQDGAAIADPALQSAVENVINKMM